MSITYFNHSTRVAQSRWERRSFLANWWRIYADDPRWVPPHYPTLRRELEPNHNPHLARMAPIFIHTEALPRRQVSTRRGSRSSALSAGFLNEQPVAAAVVLRDPRRRDATAHLALLRCVNDAESLERVLARLAEALWGSGCRRVVGPIGLAPHLDSGLLEDYWHQLPPSHTPYNPPYLPELFNSLMESIGSSRLYHLEIPPELPPSPPARAQLSPLDLDRPITDLLPLLATACSPWLDFPPPDAEEAAFLLRWLETWPRYGWLAQVDGQPAGFLLLQPDAAPLLRRANGGRHLPWRLWLSWRRRRSLRQGRVLYGGVLPQWQGQGIGHQLLHRALVTGHHLGWQTLSIGPVPGGAPACAFLERQGVLPRQTYRLYQRDL